MRRSTFIFILAFFAGLTLPARPLAAVQVQAQLSSNSTTVGRPVLFTITVDGSKNVTPPALPAVDGLQSRYVGPSTRMEIVNGQFSVSVTHSYQIIPSKEGAFTIPSIKIEVDGRTLATNPVLLQVAGGPVAPPSNVPPQPTAPGTGSGALDEEAAAENELIYAELIIPKEKAYVGELVPVEIRFYFSHRIRFQPLQPPIFSGEGYTTTKFTQPSETDQMINGEPYRILSYRTAISGVRPGKIEVGPVEQLMLVRTPRRRVDPFFSDDIFSQFFGRGGGAGGGMMSQDEQQTIRTRPVALEILPLPEAGQPSSFRGAVGQFKVDSTAEPRKAATGEPITVRASISGRGNFDRVQSPVFAESADWRTYPPKDQFQPGDDISFTGTKTFEQIFTAQSPVKALPPGEFSWFDPVTGKYEVLPLPPLPVEISGAALTPDPTPAVAAQTAEPTPSTEPKANEDILHILPSPLPWGAAPHSLLSSRLFWSAQGLPAVLLLFAGAFLIIKRRKVAAENSTKAQIEKAIDFKWQQIKSPKLAESEALKAAMAWLVLQLRKHATDETLIPTPSMALVTCASDPELAAALRGWIDRHDQLHYSGFDAASSPLPPARRKELIETLQALRPHLENFSPQPV